jgi:hypothetical protein
MAGKNFQYFIVRMHAFWNGSGQSSTPLVIVTPVVFPSLSTASVASHVTPVFSGKYFSVVGPLGFVRRMGDGLGASVSVVGCSGAIAPSVGAGSAVVGAAGVVSVGLAMKHLETGFIPALPFFGEDDQFAKSVQLDQPKHALICALGFGGNASALILSLV